MPFFSLKLAEPQDANLVQRGFVESLTRNFNTLCLQSAVMQGKPYVILATPQVRQRYCEWEQARAEMGLAPADDKATLISLRRMEGESYLIMMACSTLATAEHFYHSTPEDQRPCLGIMKLKV
jgi:hypothetical protein